MAQGNIKFSCPGILLVSHFDIPYRIPVQIHIVIGYPHIHLLSGGRYYEFKGCPSVVVAVQLDSHHISKVIVPAAQSFGDLVHIVIGTDGYKKTFIVVQHFELGFAGWFTIVVRNKLLVVTLPFTRFPAVIIQFSVNYRRIFYALCGVDPFGYGITGC